MCEVLKDMLFRFVSEFMAAFAPFSKICNVVQNNETWCDWPIPLKHNVHMRLCINSLDSLEELLFDLEKKLCASLVYTSLYPQICHRSKKKTISSTSDLLFNE